MHGYLVQIVAYWYFLKSNFICFVNLITKTYAFVQCSVRFLVRLIVHNIIMKFSNRFFSPALIFSMTLCMIFNWQNKHAIQNIVVSRQNLWNNMDVNIFQHHWYTYTYIKTEQRKYENTHFNPESKDNSQ